MADAYIERTMKTNIQKKFYFVLASMTFFNADNRLIDYIHRQKSSATPPIAFDPGPLILLGVMGVVIIAGAFGLLRSCGSRYLWILVVAVAIGVVTSLLLEVQGHSNIWLVVVLYFAPQLPVLFVKNQAVHSPGQAL